MSEAKIEGWIMIEDGVLQFDETMGLGMINGVEFQTCCDLLEKDRIKTAIEDIDFIVPKVNATAHFEITNIEWDEGQMSLPETGQWDFEPDWWFDIEITKVEFDGTITKIKEGGYDE